MSNEKKDFKNMSRKELNQTILATKKSQAMAFSASKKLTSACGHRHDSGALAVNVVDPSLCGGEIDMVECSICGERFQYKKYTKVELTSLKDQVDNIIQLYKVIDQGSDVGTHAQVGFCNLVFGSVIDQLIVNRDKLNNAEKKKKQKREGHHRGNRSQSIVNALVGGGQGKKGYTF